MSFIIRASLTIGILSYLAAVRDQPGAVVTPDTLAAVSSGWNALPAEARERAIRDGLSEAVRRFPAQASASADTLAETDRRPAWRGVDAR